MSDDVGNFIALVVGGLVGGSAGYKIGHNQRQAELEATISEQNAELRRLRLENIQLSLEKQQLEARVKNQKSIS